MRNVPRRVKFEETTTKIGLMPRIGLIRPKYVRYYLKKLEFGTFWHTNIVGAV